MAVVQENDARTADWRPEGIVADSLALPPEFTVSEWADAEREMDPKTCARPGPWCTDFTPFAREIMDAFKDPIIEQITIMKATQVAGTESMYNMLGYAIDCDPGPTMMVASDEKLAKKLSNRRVKPMIELSPALARHLTGCKDDFSSTEYYLDRMDVYWAWAGSPASLSSFAIRYGFLDEVDKYPAFSGKESDPVKLVRERFRTFRASSKLVLASTPTTKDGYINREYEAIDKRRYQVPCPHCGAY